jgi:hypothetical protein
MESCPPSIMKFRMPAEDRRTYGGEGEAKTKTGVSSDGGSAAPALQAGKVSGPEETRHRTAACCLRPVASLARLTHSRATAVPRRIRLFFRGNPNNASVRSTHAQASAWPCGQWLDPAVRRSHEESARRQHFCRTPGQHRVYWPAEALRQTVLRPLTRPTTNNTSAMTSST